MTTNHITLPREQQLAEELGFWIEEVAGVWLHREPDDRDREATLSERVLWSELLAAHPVEGDVPDSFAARWLTNGASLHPLTVNLVVRFARALASKLSAAEKKYGYSDGWRDPNWMDECRQKLAEHIAKGDPRDVAAYCAFLWHHGESTTTAQQPPAQEAVIRHWSDCATNNRGVPEMLGPCDCGGYIPPATPPSPSEEPKCSPTLTECPRCKNDISKCDRFAAPTPSAVGGLTNAEVLAAIKSAGSEVDHRVNLTWITKDGEIATFVAMRVAHAIQSALLAKIGGGK